MPLFIFISGYLSQLSNYKCMNRINRRTLDLAIPFLVWTVIRYFAAGIFLGQSFPGYLSSVFISPDNSFWFLWTLYLSNIILVIDDMIVGIVKKYWINDRYALKAIVYINSVMILLVIGKFVKVLGFDSIGRYSFFFLLGNYYCFILTENNKKRIIDSKAKYIVMIMSILLSGIWLRTESPKILIDVFKWLPKSILGLVCRMYKYITPIVGIAASIYVANIFSGLLKDFLQTLGRYTLQIYVMHGFLLLHYTNNQFIDGVLSLVIAFVIPVIIAKLIEKNDILNSYCFGRIAKL